MTQSGESQVTQPGRSQVGGGQGSRQKGRPRGGKNKVRKSTQGLHTLGPGDGKVQEMEMEKVQGAEKMEQV